MYIVTLNNNTNPWNIAEQMRKVLLKVILAVMKQLKQL